MKLSILIPSRGRPGQLLGSIAAFFRTAPGDADFEILVRLDEDDRGSCCFIQDFEAWGKTRVIVGPKNTPISRAHGLCREINLLYDELASHAKGYWVWIWNDDAWLRGNDWFQQLSALPEEPALVLAQHLQHQASQYAGHAANVLPIFPNGSWKLLGWTVVPEPVDLEMVNGIRAAGWPEHQLKDIWVVHDWRSNGIGGLNP